MFYQIVIYLHAVVCLLLMVVVLIQAGRGGGLSESFSKAESIFGTKTNAFLTRSTSVLAIVFFITCLSLAILSKHRSKSLFDRRPLPETVKTEVQPNQKQAAEPVQAAEPKPTDKPQAPQPKTNIPEASAPAAPGVPQSK